MNGFRIGSVLGIPIKLDFSFLVALPLLGFLFSQHFVVAAAAARIPRSSIAGAPLFWGLLLAIGLFVSVLLHELAHALYARRRGARVHDITLLLIGGVSRIDGEAARPRHEALMALLGPVTSLGLALALYALHGAAARWPTVSFGLFCLAHLNLLLGMFNLIPAFPMDGGRILRAALAGRMGRVGATQLAARVGVGFAVLFGLWGLLTFNWILLLIAYFVFIGARGEAQQELTRELLERVPVNDLMTPEHKAFREDMTAADAAEAFALGRRTAAPVARHDGGFLVVSLEQLDQVPQEDWPRLQLREVASAAPTLSPSQDGWSALRALGEAGVTMAPVVSSSGDLVGTLSHADIVRGLELRKLKLKLPGQRQRRFDREAHP